MSSLRARMPTLLAVAAFVVFFVLDGCLILIYAPLSTFADGSCGSGYCDYPAAMWILGAAEAVAVCLAVAVPVIAVHLARRSVSLAAAAPLFGVGAVLLLYGGLRLASVLGSRSP
ncbi:MAG: hypothetical protein JWN36_1862 [Microbacteriaceae bacterium]|nr:hypothetical protein [Microbacteriaceae bacterium]